MQAQWVSAVPVFCAQTGGIGLPCKGRWILPQAKDGGIVVSDVGALRKYAGGIFLATDRSGYAARREVAGA